MKILIGVVSLGLLSCSITCAQVNASYFYVAAKGGLTSWQGIGQDHSPDVGFEIGYDISLTERIRFAPFGEFMFYDHEGSDFNTTVNRIGFGIRPQYIFEIDEETSLALIPGIRLAQQNASAGVNLPDKQDEAFSVKGGEVTSSSDWSLNIEPAVQISIPLNETMRGGLGVFIDFTDLGQSVNKLQYNNQPIYKDNVKSNQIGLTGTLYFR